MALHEIGAHLGLPTATVRALIASGALLVARSPTNRLLTSPVELDAQRPKIEAWLASRRPGRQPLDPEHVRDRQIGVRVADADGRLLDEAAAALGVDVSTFLRMAALERAHEVIAKKKGGSR